MHRSSFEFLCRNSQTALSSSRCSVSFPVSLQYRIDSQFVIKVADFGLSESMYGREYFREGDSSVKLPLKWMAVESINDGIFSEKSDVV